MCPLTRTTMLVEDRSHGVVRCEDLGGNLQCTRVIHTHSDEFTDMCVVEDGSNELLVAAGQASVEVDGGERVQGQEGIFAYNMATDKQKWVFCGKPPGNSVADLGGGRTRRAPPPTVQNFLDFMQFFGKFDKIVCWRPPLEGWRPLLQGILDPPLGMENRMKACGLATDGRGLLLVSDQGNNCIHRFSTDGNYIECLLKGEDLLGEVGIIRWSNKRSSLHLCLKSREKVHRKEILVQFSQ